MKKDRRVVKRLVALGTALLMMGTLACSPSSDEGEQSGPGRLTPDQAKAIALDAYVYGYPLVTVEMTRRVMTNVAQVEAPRAPMGQLMRMREYPNAQFRDVTAPNADTLYTNGFIDVKNEPWVLTLPDAHDRYYLFPMLDGYTNVFEVPEEAHDRHGPADLRHHRSGLERHAARRREGVQVPTSTVWLLGRIYCDGTPEDYAAVRKLQDEISLVPLSSYGKPYTPPAGKVDPTIDMKTPVRDQVNNLSAEAYFDLLATLMKNNPPSEADRLIVDKMAELGIVAGEKFDIRQARSRRGCGVAVSSHEGFEKIMARFKELENVNGWRFTTETGQYGTDYLQRALITAIGLGANLPQDAVYPTSEADTDGQAYDGADKYGAFRQGPIPARQRVLVTDHVRRGLLLRRQSAQPLHAEPAESVRHLTPTDRSISTCSTRTPARARKPTGCPHRPASSTSCCGCTGRRKPRRRSSTARGKPPAITKVQ